MMLMNFPRKTAQATSVVYESPPETPSLTFTKHLPVQKKYPTKKLDETNGITCPCCLTTSLPHNKCGFFY